MARGVSLAWVCRMVADDIALACSVLLNINSCASDMPARYIASPSELFSLANWNAAPISPSNARLTSLPLLKSLKFETWESNRSLSLVEFTLLGAFAVAT